MSKLNEYGQPQGDGLEYSQKLSGIKPHLDRVELEFEGGHEDAVDLVIGADGINSTVAKLLNIDDEIPPIYSGANIFYGKIPQPRNTALRDHPIFDVGSVVNGPGNGEFIAFHVGAGDKQTFIWANTYASQSPPPKREDWSQADNTQELEEILSKYPDSHPIHEFAQLTGKEDLLHFLAYSIGITKRRGLTIVLFYLVTVAMLHYLVLAKVLIRPLRMRYIWPIA